MSYKQTILDKIKQNQEIVGIIGLGYVGLPLAVNFAKQASKSSASKRAGKKPI